MSTPKPNIIHIKIADIYCTEMNRKTADVSTRLSPGELAERSMAARVEAANKAMQGEKVRYKSPGDTERFLKFLEHRLTIWEELKDKTFHGKRMYEKTNEIINNIQ
jgi:hypothetical protein